MLESLPLWHLWHWLYVPQLPHLWDYSIVWPGQLGPCLGEAQKAFSARLLSISKFSSNAQNWRSLTMGPLTVPLNTKEVSSLELTQSSVDLAFWSLEFGPYFLYWEIFNIATIWSLKQFHNYKMQIPKQCFDQCYYWHQQNGVSQICPGFCLPPQGFVTLITPSRMPKSWVPL